MKVYEFGEQCEHDGILWSDLIISNEQSFEAIKTAIVAKIELDLSLTVDALDEGNEDDEGYICALLSQRSDDAKRLNLAKNAKSAIHLCRIDKIFIRQREVAEYVGCDYWSLLAAKEVSKTTNA